MDEGMRIARTLTDTGRLLWRDDVDSVCPNPDLCFEYWETVRCGPCAIKSARELGVEPNMALPALPEVSRLKRELVVITDAMAADKAEIARLRADKDRLDWLESEMNDVRWIGGAGSEMCSPSDEVGVQIVSHHQAEPQERVEAENWHEDLRAVIDEARAALEKTNGTV